MGSMRRTLTAAALLAGVAALPGAELRAQEADRYLPGAWTVNTTLGAGGVSGDYGDFLEKPVNLDMNLAKGRGKWRFGAGFQFGSLKMQSPYQDQQDWSRLETHLFATRVFNLDGKLRPYLQARFGIERVHPRSEVFHVIPEEEFAAGHNPTNSTGGVGFGLQPGVEVELTKDLALDLSGNFTLYKTGELDLSAIGRPPVTSGKEWSLQAGLTWRPLGEGLRELPATVTDPETGKIKPLPPEDAERDAWGIPRSWGWATAEVLGINFVSTTLNEYVRGESSYPVTPRTMKANIENGFKYDDNEFKTNQLIHPFNGATYFNSGRQNGIGFWGSSALALVGAFIWECCGESQPMSWNDMISTGLGGIARGEVSHRLAGVILNNTLTGKARFWRELSAAPINPTGAFNRVLSGRATKVTGNPESPYDWRPNNLTMQLSVGARVIGQGSSISENTNTYGFVEFDMLFGSAFENERRRPYDRFDTAMQLNLGDKTRMGRIAIRGDLWSKPLGKQTDGQPPRHALSVVQDFDYIDNEAYEYGGQGFGLALFSRFGNGPTQLTTRVVGYGVAAAAVNADYSFLADIPDPRELRNYDYGAGLGGGVEMLLTKKRRPLANFGYRYTWIDVNNGSLFNPGGIANGSAARHHIHRLQLRLTAPVMKHIALGADGWLFLRQSDYEALDLVQHKSQRNPEARVYLAFDLGH